MELAWCCNHWGKWNHFKAKTSLYSKRFRAFRSKERGRRVKMAQAKERGGDGKERWFPSFPFPSPSPSFIFWRSFHFSRGKAVNPIPRSFFATKPNGNACDAGYAKTFLIERILFWLFHGSAHFLIRKGYISNERLTWTYFYRSLIFYWEIYEYHFTALDV